MHKEECVVVVYRADNGERIVEKAMDVISTDELADVSDIKIDGKAGGEAVARYLMWALFDDPGYLPLTGEETDQPMRPTRMHVKE